ncbi:MAG: class I SAM-dependent methyltransferase [Candidatus Sumerlaeota bacterium]|nr:class I SAM-dependent methyltransferase [Candidatus Sumerlaeota bacterium]
MREFNLLNQWPAVARNYAPGYRTDENRAIARRYDREFFDGDRVNGYGGYKYDGRWVAVAQRMKEAYGLGASSSALDIGCAKGFLLHDLIHEIPGIRVAGLEFSRYALDNAYGDARGRVVMGTCAELPFPDKSFDVILAINTIHNVAPEAARRSVREMMRVARRHAFIQVDAWNNERERENLFNWYLTAETLLSREKWLELFCEVGYEGDCWWTTFP